MYIDKIHIAYYIIAMRIIENKEKIDKLCSSFSLLEDSDQEHIFSILQTLLFIKLKKEAKITAEDVFFNSVRHEELHY